MHGYTGVEWQKYTNNGVNVETALFNYKALDNKGKPVYWPWPFPPGHKALGGHCFPSNKEDGAPNHPMSTCGGPGAFIWGQEAVRFFKENPCQKRQTPVLKRFTHKTHSKSHHEAYAQATAFCKSKGGHLPTFDDICPKGEGKGPPALGCVSGHSWVPYSKNSDSWVFISCGGHQGLVCKDHVKHHGSPNWHAGDVFGDEIECMV